MTTEVGSGTSSLSRAGMRFWWLVLAAAAFGVAAVVIALGAPEALAVLAPAAIVALDVGAKCDIWCVISGGVSGGATGGPGSRKGFVYAEGANPPWARDGQRLTYDDYTVDSDGNPNGYSVRDPRGGPNTWVPASDVSQNRPPVPPHGRPIELREGRGLKSDEASMTTSARG